MADMLDYLDWFGDVPFDEVPFNEVDNIILSQLAYLDLAGVIPAVGEKKSITVADLAQKYVDTKGKEAVYSMAGVISPYTIFLPQKMAEGKRFANAKIFNLINEFVEKDHTAVQLVAFCTELDEAGSYIAFRGTDDTIAGWREDFQMTYMHVPAQVLAANYVNQVAGALSSPLRIGGHSKGANLAVYAAANSKWSIKRRITDIFNNDGPGFCFDVHEKHDFDSIKDKIRTYIPIFDIVGQLFGVFEPTKIIDSNDFTIMQHSAMSWQVKGTKFIQNTSGKIDDVACAINDAMNKWLFNLDMSTRDTVLNALFDCVTNANFQKLSDFGKMTPQMLKDLSSQILQLDKETSTLLTGLVADITKATLKSAPAAAATQIKEAATKTFSKQTYTIDENIPLSMEELEAYRKSVSFEKAHNFITGK